jgi:glycolate oxidase
MNSADIYDQLVALLGETKVSVDAPVLEAHAIDKWWASNLPDVVVFAETRDDVVAVMKFANEHEVPVTTRGSGVGYVGGCVPVDAGIVLSVARMARLREINPVDGVVVTEPGVILSDLQSAVKEQGMFYPPDPSSVKECSIGGTVATNAGGPKCLKYGVTRPYVLGLEVVLANGDVLRTGGRTHKNKTGFDLIGMFVGSEGLLGVITEITLRLIPNPPARATFSVAFGDYAEAASAVQTVFAAGFLPCAMEIADAFTLAAARNYPGNDIIPDGDAHLLIDLDGQPGAVKSDVGALRKLLESLDPLSIDVAVGEVECEKLWEIRRSFSYSLRDTGLHKLNQDIAVPRSRLVDLVEFCERLQADTGIAIACFGHAGDGNIHVNLMVDPAAMTNAEERPKIDDAVDQLFVQVLAWDGVITGEHGIGVARLPWWTRAVTEVGRRVHADLKKALDPKAILNPGKFV